MTSDSAKMEVWEDEVLAITGKTLADMRLELHGKFSELFKTLASGDLSETAKEEDDYGVFSEFIIKDGQKAVRFRFTGEYEWDFESGPSYDSDGWTLETMRMIAEVYGTQKINYGDIQGGGGCGSCGWGGKYGIDFYALDPVILPATDPQDRPESA
jgi:hypothetical protein